MTFKSLTMLFSGLFLSVSAQAVQTQYCPETMDIVVPEIQAFSKSFTYNQAKPMDYADYDSIDYMVGGSLKDLKIEATLVSKANSVCRYDSVTESGSEADLVISGTDKNPVLKVDYHTEEGYIFYRMFADPTSKRPVYNFTGATLQFKAIGRNFVWDTWIGKNISVGKGTIQ